MPLLHANPMRPRQIRRRTHSLALAQLRHTLRTGRQYRYALPIAVEIQHGKHLPADGFFADPEDKVRAPLHALLDMLQRVDKVPHPFVIHIFATQIQA